MNTDDHKLTINGGCTIQDPEGLLQRSLCTCDYSKGMGPNLKCPVHGGDKLLIGVPSSMSAEKVSLAPAGESTPAPFDPDDLTDEEKKERLQTIEEMLAEIGRTGQNQHIIFDALCDIVMVGDY